MPQAHGAVDHGITPAGFQVPWDSRADSLSKELVPIILSCAAWGQSWHTCQVRVVDLRGDPT